MMKAHRVLRRFEFHYAPKHVSWLNMVEIEISVLAGQCLNRRIESCVQLTAETAVWEQQRNAAGARIKWMFTTEEARTKMEPAYPVQSPWVCLRPADKPGSGEKPCPLDFSVAQQLRSRQRLLRPFDSCAEKAHSDIGPAPATELPH